MGFLLASSVKVKRRMKSSSALERNEEFRVSCHKIDPSLPTFSLGLFSRISSADKKRKTKQRMGYFSSRNVLERLKFSNLIVTGEAL